MDNEKENLPPLPSESGMGVYSADQMRAYARAAVTAALEAPRAAPDDAQTVSNAAEALLEVLDAYPEQLVPINRKSATVTRLREALAAAPAAPQQDGEQQKPVQAGAPEDPRNADRLSWIHYNMTGTAIRGTVVNVLADHCTYGEFIASVDDAMRRELESQTSA